MKNYYLLPILLFSLVLLSYEDDMEDDQDQVSIGDVVGQWLRIESNDDPADAIIINVQNGQAVITDAVSANININDILWINIMPVGPES